MTPEQIIANIAPGGVELVLSPSGELSARGDGEALSHWLPVIRGQKAGLIALLQASPDEWSMDDWLIFFGERAAIAEFDGGLTRAAAERQAFACCIVEWLDRRFLASPPGRCLGCGGADQTNTVLTPYGGGAAGHVWLHPRCWVDWYAQQKAVAIAGLQMHGIEAASEFLEDFGEKGAA